MTNTQKTPPTFDFFALGEAVIDLISAEVVAQIDAASRFERFTGGQVANLAKNMARLGNRVAIGSCVGDDGFGNLLRAQLDGAGVETGFIQVSTEAPTTLIPVTRTTRGTPEFLTYRGADAHLQADENLLAAAGRSRLVHTSAFGLSRDPARSTILKIMQQARANGNLVSLDPNYHPRIWPDRSDFTAILKDAYQFVNITKPSMDDCARLWGDGFQPAEYAEKFLAWGAQIVVISMGDAGVYFATNQGDTYQLTPRAITVADVTGAGDAFWSGLLTALLQGADALDAARAGQVVAEIKISALGPISRKLAWDEILTDAQTIAFQRLTAPASS